LRRWLIEVGKPDVSTLKQYVDMLPKHLTRRFISADQDAVVVSGRVPDVDASRLLPVLDALGKSLDMHVDILQQGSSDRYRICQ
jgi:hypothetical protein